MKYIIAFLAALMLSACTESPQETKADGADAIHAHDGDAHSHEGEADHGHEGTETEVFYGDQAESASEVGTVGGPSVTGLDHEHDEDADHHHDETGEDPSH